MKLLSNLILITILEVFSLPPSPILWIKKSKLKEIKYIEQGHKAKKKKNKQTKKKKKQSKNYNHIFIGKQVCNMAIIIFICTETISRVISNFAQFFKK